MIKPFYQSGNLRIYCGDSREIVPQLEVQVDVLVTDPPYGVNLKANPTKQRANYLHKDKYLHYEDTPQNFEATVIPVVQDALKRVKRGVVFCAGGKIGKFPEPDAIGGVYLPSGCGRTAWGFTQFSPCLLYGQAPEIHKGCKPTTIRWTGATEENGHPCPKPLQWMLWAVGMASLPGEMVLDPFMGSGTTLRACKDLGRPAVGIELTEEYCEIAVKRLAQEVLFGDAS